MAKFEDEEIITLKNSDGQDIDFINIAGISLDSGYYLILQPKELLDGMADDEALVFECENLDDGTDSFKIVLDDDIVEKVFEEYYRLLDEAEEA